jgi:hypothetical protein
MQARHHRHGCDLLSHGNGAHLLRHCHFPVGRLGGGVIAGGLLAITAPLMLAVVLAIRWESRGPIFARRNYIAPGGRCTSRSVRSDGIEKHPYLPLGGAGDRVQGAVAVDYRDDAGGMGDQDVDRQSTDITPRNVFCS